MTNETVVRCRTSDVLVEVLDQYKDQETIDYETLMQVLGRRSFGICIVLFSLPSALPFSMIPGFSFLFSLPISFLAFQLMIGREALWLPEKLAHKRIKTKNLYKVINQSKRWLIRLEKLLKPRIHVMSSSWMRHVNGFMLLALGLLLSSPIPLSNAIFAALIVLFGLGITVNDGLFLIVAYLLTAIYLIVLVFIISYIIQWLM